MHIGRFHLKVKELALLIFLSSFSLFLEAQRIDIYKIKKLRIIVKVDSILEYDSTHFRYFISTIEIKRKGSQKIIQSIKPNSKEGFYDGRLLLGDFNFDKSTDFRAQGFMSEPTPNIPFFNWLYDRKTQMFKNDTLLDKITYPHFSKTKLITSFWRGNCCDTCTFSERRNYCHLSSTYRYINGKLTLIEETREIIDSPEHPGEIEIFHKKLVNNKLELIEHKIEVIPWND
jgi:hypothetical protein